jgi:hypothetical protein
MGKREFIYPKDLQTISGQNIEHCRLIVRRMKKKYNVKYITIDIYKKETGIDLTDKIK